MPGWLRRAAAWASRSTRPSPAEPPESIALTATGRSRRPSQRTLVDGAEAAAADAALDQKPVSRTREPTNALSGFAANPLPPATYSLLLGGFARNPAGSTAAATPSP